MTVIVNLQAFWLWKTRLFSGWCLYILQRVYLAAIGQIKKASRVIRLEILMQESFIVYHKTIPYLQRESD